MQPQENHHKFIISTVSNNSSNPAFELYEFTKNIMNDDIDNLDLFTVIYALDVQQQSK
ncbi:MAG: hypothetical protein WDO14_14170 [Bacteroidota bacterium]